MQNAWRNQPLAWTTGAVLAFAALITPAAARDDQVSDWPCVQRKVQALTSTQMWDGPAVDDVTAWREDPDVIRVLPRLVSRRVSLEEAAIAIRRFADGVVADARDEKLKLLFAAVLAAINVDRSAVMNGIERFQKRQKARAAELERQGLALKALREKAVADSAAKAELAQAEERYDWDARVFSERQQSIPVACEIPVLIEQRVFELGREIRFHMKD